MSAPLLEPKVLREMTRVHPYRNLAWLAVDFLTGAAILSATIYFIRNSASWGLPWAANVPAVMIGAILVACVQHRIALMGHEASHYMLYPNRRINDFLAELLCFFPLFGTLTQYRAKHLGHHLYPNEPGLDPNMAGSRAARLYARFPMPKPSFIYQYYLKFFWPPFVFHNFLDLFRVITMGQGLAPMSEDTAKKVRRKEPAEKRPLYKNTTLYGIAYLLVIVCINLVGKRIGSAPLHISFIAAMFTIAVIGWRCLPAEWFDRTGGKLAYSQKTSGLLRLIFYTLLFGTVGVIHGATGFWAGLYFMILWVPGLIYITPYLMLLREVYQHANADTGDLTNSRVIHADPFTQWALLGYGNDIHLVHHIYPNIPHYSLNEAHQRLKAESPDYDRDAEETYGIISASGHGRQSLLDALAAETHPEHDRSPAPGTSEQDLPTTSENTNPTTTR